MAKTTEIAKPRQVLAGLSTAPTNVPAHLQTAEPKGVELLGRAITPPRAKVTQGNRGPEYADFPEGAVILTPMKVLLAKNEEPFHFIPLLHFPEWCTVNPIETKGRLPMIRERTLDGRSELAIKCQDPTRRQGKDPCPEQPGTFLRHLEFLNFIVVVVGRPDLQGMPISLSFASSEWKVGSQLAAYIKMRRIDICGCVFEGKVPKTKRTNPRGSWYGIDVTNPSEASGVPSMVEDPEEFKQLMTQHEQLAEAYEAKLIKLEYDDPNADEASGPQSEAAKSM